VCRSGWCGDAAGKRTRHWAEKPGWQLALDVVCVMLQIAVWTAVVWFASEQFPDPRRLRFDAERMLAEILRVPLVTLNERGYSAADLFWLVSAVAGLWLAVSIVTRLLSARLRHATGASSGALQPVATLVKYALISIGLVVILQVAGLNLSSIAILASVLGVGIGFGLQSIANNFVSGVIISFERPIKPGDFVSIGELKGTVLRIGARSTIIRTLDRVSIIVPNSHLLEQEVVNWSYGDELARLHVPVGVADGADIDRVRAELLGAAKAHPGVLLDPHPEVRFLGFGDSGMDFDLLVWTHDPPGQAVLQSDLYYLIEAALRRAGIATSSPQRTLHVSAEEIGGLVERLRAVPRSVARAAAAPSVAAAAPPADAAGGVGAPGAHAPVLDIDSLVARMRGPDGLAIEDRRHLLSVYPKCFLGSEAVQWLMRAGDLSREAAIRLGQSLVERGVIHHVLDEHPFRDGHFYYRFYADEKRP